MYGSIIMWNNIGRIITMIAKDMGISDEQALSMFYESRVNRLMRDPSTMLYTYGDRYLADEVIMEVQH